MFEIRPFERKNQITSYDPFREIERHFFGDDFFGSSLFDDGFFPMMAMPMGRIGNSLAEFKTDIQDKGDSYLLEADLPGFKKEDISIDFDDDIMTISAQRHSEHEEKDKKGNFVRCERSYGSYKRSFDLSGIKADEMTAEYKDGVLRLTMPKKVETVPASRRLEIQ